MTPATSDSAPRELPRREARTRALELLFAADLRGVPFAQATEGDDRHVDAFTQTLLDAVTEHVEALDATIAARARGWSLERMPGVDRTILRLALAEMTFVDDVPVAVAIDEAVELAKTLSTDDSPGFINGILSAVARDAGLLS